MKYTIEQIEKGEVRVFDFFIDFYLDLQEVKKGLEECRKYI